MAKLIIDKDFFDRVKINPKSLSKFSEIKIEPSLFDFQKSEAKLIISKDFDELKLDGQDPLDNAIKNIELTSDTCRLILVNNMITNINVNYDNINALSKIRVDETQSLISVLIEFNDLKHTGTLQECYLPDLCFFPYNFTFLNMNPCVTSLKLFCFHELIVINGIEIVFEKVLEVHVNSLNYHIISKITTSCADTFDVVYYKPSIRGNCLVDIENPKLGKVHFVNSPL